MESEGLFPLGLDPTFRLKREASFLEDDTWCLYTMGY
jgi:hypothetical protein